MANVIYTLPGNVEAPSIDRGHRTWGIDQVFMGPEMSLDPNKTYVVPNQGDVVRDVENRKEYYVHAIGENYTPDLRPWEPNLSPDTQKNLLIGYGVGAVNEAYRIYYNRRTVPNTLTISQYCYVNGNEVVGYKLFRGYETGDNGEVISRYYDASGDYLGNVIPVEKFYREPEWKLMPGISHVQDNLLSHGDIVTAVFINRNGTECSSAILKVEETNLTPALNQPFREVINVTVKSPHLDKNDSSVLKVPNNTMLTDLMMEGAVHYKDGTTRTFKFDQTHGQVFGLEGRVLTRPDSEYDISVSYYLQDDEFCTEAKDGVRKHYSFPMVVKTFEPDSSNAVKLFVVPKFDKPGVGYKLQYWLYDLERNVPIDVTNKIDYHDLYEFNPLDYGNRQRIQPTLDLSEVHPRYSPFIYTQEIEMHLLGEPNNNNDGWRMRYSLGTGWIGEDLEAFLITDDDKLYLDIGNNYTRWEQFFVDLYRKIGPISDEPNEIYASDPTHVIVERDGVEVRLDRDSFNEPFLWPSTIAANDTVSLRWVNRINSRDYHLGVTPLIVKSK